MPKIIYYSRSFTWYLQNPRVHVSRIQKRVSKLVNFEVQKVQKPELFDFTDTCPWSGHVMPSFCHTPHLWAIFLSNIMLLGPCVVLMASSGLLREHLVNAESFDSFWHFSLNTSYSYVASCMPIPYFCLSKSPIHLCLSLGNSSLLWKNWENAVFAFDSNFFT